ncbi:MAG: helix-turn-helix transcriptional regulator [Hyphomicrobiales bacterium]|nr:helix-turn-helix transcriptional regulator [Hyphomicrobiales bacterium]
MTHAAVQPVTLHTFSSRQVPEPRRLALLRDLFDRSIQLELDSAGRQALDMRVWSGPALRRAEIDSPLTARLSRPAAMLADGEDTVCLMIKSAGHMSIEQRGRVCVPDLGDGAVLVYREAAQLRFEAATYVSIRVPFISLERLTDVESAAARRIASNTPALALLRAYVSCLPTSFDDPTLARICVGHVHDLMALALGATGDALEAAASRSVRVARRQALFSDLARDCETSIEQLAAKHGITPRYIQMLLAESGTTFTDEVRKIRLEKARCLLLDPATAHLSIAAVAFDAGFGDIAHFNRSFKKHYGMSPSEMRNAARAPAGR